ncbi:MAG: PhoH family protein [Lachnospiraceae bacterium]|nr:PhoH family protein [Lachnospiraceae bacterium]
MSEIYEKKVEVPAEYHTVVFGVYDSNLRKIEKNFNVNFSSHNGDNVFSGDEKNVECAIRVIDELNSLAGNGEEITAQTVDYAISVALKEIDVKLEKLSGDIICHTVMGKIVAPKTVGQKNYVDNIKNKMITFGIGPAGTGKTYLAMAMAIDAFKKDEVMRIILTRPAIEAGEKLGFLPGDLQSKVDPYLRPLYDALYQIMGAEQYQKNFEKGLIEVAPLAYMRGRTLDNSFIILDEAQNTTPAQMKMFLTRIGFGSKVVVTGDLSQKDLPDGQISGLDNALYVLKKVDDIGVSYLTSVDIVRHPLVQKIVNAYDKYEEKKSKQREHSNSGKGTSLGNKNDRESWNSSGKKRN